VFLKNSRYYGQDTVSVTDRKGRPVSALKIRALPDIAGNDFTVTEGDRLDILCETTYRDATRFWHIADANTELEAGELVRNPARTIKVPEK
jgi:hypothetical protein